MAAFDWFLSLAPESEDHVLRFGTISTAFKNMTAFRDFQFGEEISSIDKSIWCYVTMVKVKEEIEAICRIPLGAHDRGSLYPYLSSLGWITKNDMSSSSKPNIHNYVNCVACLLGYPRGKNSRHMQEGDVSFVLNAGFAAYYRYRDSEHLLLANWTDDAPEEFQNGDYRTMTPSEAHQAMLKDGNRKVSAWVKEKARAMEDARSGTIGKYLYENGSIPVTYEGVSLQGSHPPTNPTPPRAPRQAAVPVSQQAKRVVAAPAAPTSSAASLTFPNRIRPTETSRTLIDSDNEEDEEDSLDGISDMEQS